MDQATLRKLGVSMSQALSYQRISELEKVRDGLIQSGDEAAYAVGKALDGYLQLAYEWRGGQ